MFYQIVNEGEALPFYDFLDDAVALAAGHWDGCRARSDERSRSEDRLVPLLLFEGYTVTHDEQIAGLIRDELTARMSLDEFVDFEVNRLLDVCDYRAMVALGVPGWEGVT